MKKIMIMLVLGGYFVICSAMDRRYVLALSICRPELPSNREIPFGSFEWEQAYQKAYERAASGDYGPDRDEIFKLPKQFGSYQAEAVIGWETKAERHVSWRCRCNPYELIAGHFMTLWSRTRD